MTNTGKEVYFTYCNACKHKGLEEDESPCDFCLPQFHRPDSHRPMFYEADNKLVKEETK